MKTIWRTTCGVVLAWLVFGTTYAAAQSQGTMNRQAEQEFETADAELNKVYSKVIAGMNAEDLQDLKAAQRLWVQFRDAQATFEANGDARGGSMQPMLYNACRTKLTKARTAEFRQMLGGQ